MTIHDLIKEATEILKEAGVSEPLLESRVLLEHAIDRNRAFLFAHPEFELDQTGLSKFRSLISRRKLREPLQYILGKQEFYGLDFKVSPDVLIPRPETEILVKAAIDAMRRIETPTFLEVGAGSGCISIAILKEVSTARGTAVDICPRALEVSRVNAETHSVSNRLTLLTSDLFASVPETSFDLIVSNPPYVPSIDVPDLQPEVRDFEPIAALTDGGDGLSIIRDLIYGSAERLDTGGHLIVEIGFGQSVAVQKMFAENIWKTVMFLGDFQQIPRVVIGIRN